LLLKKAAAGYFSGKLVPGSYKKIERTVSHLTRTHVAISKNPKILVVNDDPGSLVALTSLLNDWARANDCDVFTARSGQEALRHVLQFDFAVILLDVNMPGMDGFETAEAIHSRERSESVPIIFVTAFLADEINRLKGYQQGAVDYLFTPIIPQILQAKVSVFVTLAKKNIELNQHAETLRQRTAELLASNNQLQSEINQRKIAVEQNKAKDEFLAMLGHELRNPLSAITSAASLIAREGISDAAMERAKIILHRQTKHLTRIVDDLLELSRVMSGKVLLSNQAIEFSKIVEGCIETAIASERATHHQVNFSSEIAWINGDAARVEQIVTNLIDNALKYTPHGGTIDITVQLKEQVVALTVKDSGIGIPADLLPRIFDVFVQGEISLDRAKGGLGIGLALVKQLVELHNGTIAAISGGQGAGSTFEIEFPLRDFADSTVIPIVNPTQHPARRILLIEDNQDAREMMEIMLSAYGHTIFQAENGPDGLARAVLHQPELILIDIGLPGMDGYQVAKALRNNAETRHIHLIALTGYGLEEDRLRSLEAGFDLHLVKPIHAEDLHVAIQTVKNPQGSNIAA
jgi:two-component system, sensor histidine kinase